MGRLIWGNLVVDLPGSDERTVIIGATGSGKTQFGVWLLSTRDFDRRRWFVLDFKGEKLFAELGLTPWAINSPLPESPGIYWLRILPGQESEVSQFFLNCYNSENVGIYIDEGYMLPYQDRWVRACLTQGRSKNIEIICLTQRPVKIDVFFFSEASFFGVFNLRVKDDKKRVSEYMDGLEIPRLPRFHCLWYQVAVDQSVVFEPVPPANVLIEAFREEIEEAEQAAEIEDGIIKL